MKKVMILLFVFFTLNSAFAQTFTEGVHYEILDLPKEKEKIFIMYSVYCPFCYQYHKSVIPKLNLPEKSTTEYIFMEDMGPYGKTLAKILAMAKLKGEDQYTQVKNVYFDEIMVKKNNSENSLISIGLKNADITLDEYIKLQNNKEVLDIVKEWKSLAYPIAVKQGIPSIVVNGNMLILPASIGSVENLNQLILYLLEK